MATAETAAGAVPRGGGGWGRDVTEDRLNAVDQLDEGSGDFFDEGVGQGAEGEGAVEAAPGRGPVLKFVGGAEGAAEIVGTSGELGGDIAAPLLRALEVESDFDEAGFADGPDLVVEVGVGEVQLERGEDDAGLRRAVTVADGGHGLFADALEEVTRFDAR